MESAENQTELFEALLKWMASFRVAAGKMIREGLTKGTLSWLLPLRGGGGLPDIKLFSTTKTGVLLLQNTVSLF